MAVQGIPESSPIDDNPGSGAGSSFESQSHGEKERRLLSGRDEVSLSPPACGALAIVQDAILDGISRELGVARPSGKALRGFGIAQGPEQRASRLCSEAGAMLHQATLATHADPGGALARGAREGMSRAFEILDRLGHLGGESGEAVARLVDAWGSQVNRLVAAASKRH